MSRMSSKAQGMPINIIIIAAISLLVLVILVLIFTGRTTIFTKESGNCVNNGGTCVSVATDCSTVGEMMKESTSYKCYYTASNIIPEGKKAGDQNTEAKCCIGISP
jgi:uncharacterized membrane protein